MAKIKKHKKIVKLKSKVVKSLKSVKAEENVNPFAQDLTCANGKVRKKRTRSGKMYFTQDTEDAVVKYNGENNHEAREIIYKECIKAPFEKLVENVFNTFKFSYFEVGPADSQKECLSFLMGNVHKFESGKGKAFSYFSVMAKNYFILQNNTNYRRFKQHVEIHDQPTEKKELTVHPIVHHKNTQLREFVKLMVSYWEAHINNVFTKRRDLTIANAVVELFRNSDRIENFNKKALYLYVREISDCKTQHITKVINKMKSTQEAIARKYFDTGYVSPEDVLYTRRHRSSSKK